MAITAKQAVEAAYRARGFISQAADLIGCTRQHFYRLMDKYSTVAEAVEEAREKRHDYVETQLMKLIDDGNVTAIIFYAKTQLKKRGYVERQEVTGVDGQPVQFTTVEVVKDYGADDAS